MKSPLRQRIGHIAGSLQMASYRLIDIIPTSVTRALFLRSMGMTIGKDVAINHGIQVRLPHRITIGDDVFLAEDLILDGRGDLTVGSHSSFASRAQVWTAQHDWKSPDFAYVSAPVTIGSYCWIGPSAIVLPGVKIGDGAVVAAGSIVVADVDPWTLVGGNPARKLRDRPNVREYRLNPRRNKVLFW